MGGPAQVLAWRALCATAALMAPTALLAPLAIAPLFIIAVLCALPALRTTVGRETRLPWISVPLVVGIAWMIASTSWSIDPARSATSSLPILLSSIGGICLVLVSRGFSPQEQATIEDALTAGMILALLLLSAEAASRALGFATSPHAWLMSSLGKGYNESKLNRGATVVVLLAWTCAAAVARRRGFARAALIVLWSGAVLPELQSQAAILAWCFGGMAALTSALAPRFTRMAMIVGIATMFAAMPLIPNSAPFRNHFANDAQLGSVWHRAEIWSFVSRQIAERPVLGWGLDSSRAMPGGSEKIRGNDEWLPLHPHNGILQLWLELGAIGGAIGASIAARAAWRASDPGEDLASRFAMTGTLAAALAVFCTAYGTWQGWWMATLWLATLFASGVGATRRR
ncbi:MAG: O-antigen ligase family protein [Alphaproteobacteria bacterium]